MWSISEAPTDRSPKARSGSAFAGALSLQDLSIFTITSFNRLRGLCLGPRSLPYSRGCWRSIRFGSIWTRAAWLQQRVSLRRSCCSADARQVPIILISFRIMTRNSWSRKLRRHVTGGCDCIWSSVPHLHWRASGEAADGSDPSERAPADSWRTGYSEPNVERTRKRNGSIPLTSRPFSDAPTSCG